MAVYTDTYYNHFTGKYHGEDSPMHREQNYLLRYTKHLPSYSYDLENMTIAYYYKGHGDILWKDRRQTLKDDCFLVTNPIGDDWFYDNKDIGKRLDTFCVVVTPALKKQFEKYYLGRSCHLLDDPFTSINDELIFIERAFSANHYPVGLLLKNFFESSNTEQFESLNAEEIVITVLNGLYNNHITAYRLARRIPSKKSSTRLETLKRLLVAREYIHDNLHSKVSLDELTRVSSLSKFHLFESFKCVFRKTPHQYANHVKLEKAKELLINGQYSVGHVAVMLGFSDIYSFSRLFKNKYSVPPSLIGKHTIP
ncbi:helix-turn-helix transcriptional regulator [Tunicatimonas pelagia]|uniref:helix-turn-helix transcriptional regulator n=1 Tax=Tunicatimonas pelagia TaxID=931531 RepID=UPI00266652A7|nr:AraC family transcriptional regulator [Tunicatimonas pelagia]WKN42070.1 AraC family transcriptional regulator [Tunicatimonas pelagia]